MTFTLEQARLLRDSLPDLKLTGSLPIDEKFADYLAHYGLADLQSPWPLSHSLGALESGQFRLACQYFAVPADVCKGNVVTVHGYYDHVGLFRHPIEFCLSRGYSVLAFDLPGHGLSGGDPASIASFDFYSQALVDCIDHARRSGLVGPWHVLAQSTGAAAVINCLLKPDRFPLGEVQKILLLAPLLRPVDWHSGLVRYQVMRWFVRRVRREFARNSHDEDFLRFIAEDDPLQARYLMVDWVKSLKNYLDDFAKASVSRVPLHIIQGTDDTTVDWRYNLPALQEKFACADSCLIEGARHHLVNESEDFRTRVFEAVGRILDD